jgi:integrase
MHNNVAKVATWWLHGGYMKGTSMARKKKDAVQDLAQACDLTASAIERLSCPAGKSQAFLRDAKCPGLRVRVTLSGTKSYVFEGKLNRQTIRRTIGDVRVWAIEAARVEARRLRVVLDKGEDPREQERQASAAAAAIEAASVACELTVGEVWPRYLAEGRPKRKDSWKPRYRADLEMMASVGGVPKKRGAGVTRPGPLHPLLMLPLAAVSEDTLKSWYDAEALKSRHQAARGLMMFRGFLRWCSARPEYRHITNREAGKAASIVECLPSIVRRTDALEAAQVAGWWAGVEQLNNRTASVYLRVLLLTGARREELAALTWANVDFKWCKLTIADKVEATRTIPLTPYVAQVLVTLPRINAFVFASDGRAGRIADTRASHKRVLNYAGISGLSIHGLRRSFSLLGEAAGAPAGAIAQVMGHRPSATAEGYRPRSVDALRPFLTSIEQYIIALAGVTIETNLEHAKLRAVG